MDQLFCQDLFSVYFIPSFPFPCPAFLPPLLPLVNPVYLHPFPG